MKSWLLILVLGLTACGGGGSGSGEDVSGEDRGRSNSDFSEPDIIITAEPGTIDRANMPRLASVVLDTIVAGRQIYSLWSDGDFFERLETGVTEEECNHGGTLTLDLNAGRSRLTERYDDCRIMDSQGNYYSINGRVRTGFSGIESGGNFTVKSIYRDYEVKADNGESESFEAVIEFTGNRNAYQDFYPAFNISLQASNNIEGEIRVKDFSFDIAYDADLFNSLETISISGGELEYAGVGAVEIKDAGRNQIELAGNSEDIGWINFGGEDIEFYFDAAGGSEQDAALNFSVYDIGGIDFNRDNEYAPYRRPYGDPIGYYLQFTEGEVAEISSLEYFRHKGGRLLDFQLSVGGSVPQNVSIEEEEAYVEPELSIRQSDVGVFQIELAERPKNDEITFYLYAYATDTDGRMGSEPVGFPVTFFRDTDGDGERDVDDSDDDGDGVNDYEDAFPKDRSESGDFDGDGVGDNEDPDDDNDGVEDQADAYPKDLLCHIEEDGNGERCLLWEMTDPIWQKMLDNHGVVMYYSDYHRTIYRWDSTTENFIESIELNPSIVNGNSSAEEVYYSSEHHALYALYRGNGISRIDLNSIPIQEVPFMDWGNLAGNLAVSYRIETTQNFIEIIGRTTQGIERYSYNLNGQYIDSFIDNLQLTGPEYYRPPEVSPFCEWGVTLNTQTGIYEDIAGGNLDDGEEPEQELQSDLCSDMREKESVFPYVAPDGASAIIADGSIVDRSGSQLGTNKINLGVVMWNKAGIFSFDDDEYTYSRYDSSGNFQEKVELEPYFDVVQGNENHLLWFNDPVPHVVDLHLTETVSQAEE